MQDLQIAPAFLVRRLVLVAEGGKAESRGSFGGVSEDRDCVVKVSLVAEYLVVFV